MMIDNAMRFYGAPQYFMSVYRERLLNQFARPDAGTLPNGKVRIALSQLDGSQTNLNNSASWIVGDFTSTMDLANAIAGSSYIPCLSGLDTYTVFRNQPVIDGAYGNGFEDFCPGGDVQACLKLGTWHVGPLGNFTCDPQYCDCATQAADRTDRVKTLYSNDAYVDRWALNIVANRCPPSTNPAAYAGLDPYPLPDFVPQDSTRPDIHPVRVCVLWAGKGENRKGTLQDDQNNKHFSIPPTPTLTT
jgi:hypothetical protein